MSDSTQTVETPEALPRPLFNKVLISLDAEVEERRGSIIVPSTVQKNEVGQTGAIIAVGPGLWNDMAPAPARKPMSVVVGMKVLFNRHAGIDLRLKDGGNYKLIYETDIWGVFP
jgi:co-chaperonin GroES (HSP10)